MRGASAKLISSSLQTCNTSYYTARSSAKRVEQQSNAESDSTKHIKYGRDAN
jgi:hypothetical protein